MCAALDASDETVSFLLSKGVSPDETDNIGRTALIYAIQSKCTTTINILAPVTYFNLGKALHKMIVERVDQMTEELKRLVEKVAQDRETAIDGLHTAALSPCLLPPPFHAKPPLGGNHPGKGERGARGGQAAPA